MPMYGNSDRDAIKIACKTSMVSDADKLKMVRIKNTLELFEFEVSTAYLQEIKDRDDFEILSDPYTWQFDNEGNLF